MKFGKYVEDNAVPEWASKYLEYKQLKKKIKRITHLPPNELDKGKQLINNSLLLLSLLQV